MQSLRSVFAKVYCGGRSMGSRNFSSSPPGSNASNVAVRYLLRGITAAGAYAIAPYISRQKAADSKLEGERNETLRKLDEFYEENEQRWSQLVVDNHILNGSRKRQ